MVSFLVTLITLAVIAGFIITLVTHTYWLSLIIAGCIILILESFFGVIELKKTRKQKILFPIVNGIVGLCFVISGMILKTDPDGLTKFFDENVPLACLLLFLIAGIALILHALTEPRWKRRYCTEKVTGTCVELQRGYTHKGYKASAPVYEFNYAGGVHRIAESSYSRFANPKIGEEREIYVDVEAFDETDTQPAIHSTKPAGSYRFVAMSLVGFIMVYVV